mgnify:CR=1 FL=1
MQKLIDKKLFKFLIVGVINTLVGTAIMFGMYNIIGADYWVSSITNYVLTSILSFFLNKYFTFENKTKSFSQVLKFIINIIVCYGLAYGIAKPLVKYVLSAQSKNIRDNVAMLIGMCLFTGLNYIGQRFFAFISKRKEGEN